MDNFVMEENSGDPADAPPSHYKIQPESDGKLIFPGPQAQENLQVL